MTFDRRKLKGKRLKTFLLALRRTGNITRSAQLAGVSRQCVQQRKAADPLFKQHVEEALDEGLDEVEEKLRQLGMDGEKTLVLYQGQPVIVQGEMLYETRHSVTALLAILRAYRPDVYGTKLNLTGKVNSLAPKGYVVGAMPVGDEPGAP